MSYRALDPTLPEVENFLIETFSEFKRMGFTFFKLDFLYPICLYANYHKNMTRAQALYHGLSIIRRTIGTESTILTAVSPLSPLVSITDSARTGLDILNPYISKIPLLNGWINNFMLKNNLSTTKLREHFHKKIWISDPDVLIFRRRTGISKTLLSQHYDFVKNNQSNAFIGDSYANLNKKERANLIKFFNEL